jgi:hypothetical protein
MRRIKGIGGKPLTKDNLGCYIRWSMTEALRNGERCADVNLKLFYRGEFWALHSLLSDLDILDMDSNDAHLLIEEQRVFKHAAFPSLCDTVSFSDRRSEAAVS